MDRSTWATLSWVRSQGQAFTRGLMAAGMKATGKTTKFTDWGSIYGQMGARTQASGAIT